MGTPESGAAAQPRASEAGGSTRHADRQSTRAKSSFGGGGTDLEAYSAQYGGLVLSAAINRYAYVFINAGEADGVQISSADMQLFNNRRPGGALPECDGDPSVAERDNALRLPWAVLRYFGIQHGLNIFLASEVPPGTGLGSSSTMAVALVKALAALADHPFSRAQVAEIASRIEIGDLAAPIGRQDQYAAAFGGLNTIRFGAAGAGQAVEVEPLALTSEQRQKLERHLLLFFTGTARNSGNILREQRAATADRQDEVLQALDTIKALALEMRAAILADELGGFGELLHESWQHKKRLAGGITTPGHRRSLRGRAGGGRLGRQDHRGGRGRVPAAVLPARGAGRGERGAARARDAPDALRVRPAGRQRAAEQRRDGSARQRLRGTAQPAGRVDAGGGHADERRTCRAR